MENTVDMKSFGIGVLGAGSWGTALANLLAKKGFRVHLWAYEEEVKRQIETENENKIFLKGFTLSSNIIPTNCLKEAVSGKRLLLAVVPSHVLRETLLNARQSIDSGTIIVSASKGIENKTHLTMSGVLKEVLSDHPERLFTVLSGPSFAKEVAMDLPTAVTVAGEDEEVTQMVQHIFATPGFRVYTHTDMMGVELGGAVKNVIAIAAGIIDGLKLGLNTRAALITRGLTEIRRLGIRMGANPRTFTGLAGMGDLVLTCTGDLSRNHSIGKRIGEGEKLKNLLSDMRMVAEGVKNASSVYNLSMKLGVEMPICHAIYDILYNDLSPQEALYQLMTRDLKQEMD